MATGRATFPVNIPWPGGDGEPYDVALAQVRTDVHRELPEVSVMRLIHGDNPGGVLALCSGEHLPEWETGAEPHSFGSLAAMVFDWRQRTHGSAI